MNYYLKRKQFKKSFLRDVSINCSCYLTLGPQILPNKTACDMLDLCPPVLIRDFRWNPNKYYDVYLPSCPLECDSIRYDTRISSQNYPSKEEYEIFKKDATMYSKYKNILNVTTYNEYKKYFFKMNVFYDSMEYTYVTLSPKLTFVQLLATLGGSLGALLGFTLVTVFETLEILFYMVYILLFKN